MSIGAHQSIVFVKGVEERGTQSCFIFVSATMKTNPCESLHMLLQWKKPIAAVADIEG